MNVILAPDNLHDRWDDFVKAQAPDGGILQSWRWGDFQKSLGHKIFRLATLDGKGEIKAVALLIKHELHFEYNYLYCPRGPVTTSITDMDDLKLIFDDIKAIAKEEKSFMIKVDPPWAGGSEQRLEGVGFRHSEYEVQPKCNFVINITKTEDELMTQMKQKTRYNIGLAERRGVKMRLSTEASDIEPFWELTKQTAKRDGFSSHGKEHYKKMFNTFRQDHSIKLFMAEFDKKIISAAMVSFFGNFSTYLHGASSDMYRDVMAPYLIHWEAIKEARNLGCQYYDFGGCNSENWQDPKWEGITRFKRGYAPEVPVKEYIGSYELIFKPAIFAAYKFAKQMRS